MFLFAFSFSLFFHYILHHDMGAIEEWMQVNRVFLLMISKSSIFLLYVYLCKPIQALKRWLPMRPMQTLQNLAKTFYLLLTLLIVFTSFYKIQWSSTSLELFSTGQWVNSIYIAIYWLMDLMVLTHLLLILEKRILIYGKWDYYAYSFFLFLLFFMNIDIASSSNSWADYVASMLFFMFLNHLFMKSKNYLAALFAALFYCIIWQNSYPYGALITTGTELFSVEAFRYSLPWSFVIIVSYALIYWAESHLALEKIYKFFKGVTKIIKDK
jgi:hypothetical protein